jgi:hypothetical protein
MQATVHTGRRFFAVWLQRGQHESWEGKATGERAMFSH